MAGELKSSTGYLDPHPPYILGIHVRGITGINTPNEPLRTTSEL